jgi:aminopeptidase N
VGRVLQTAAACAAYLDERYGAREKLPHVKIVLAPRNGPGYARTNYIVITDVAKLPPDALSRFLCHELAHFWSSGAIASGPENWLNEAFAEFVALRYVRSVHGQEAFDRIMNQFRTISEKQPAVWTPTGTARPSGMVAYRKAPYLLHRLEERLGTEVMDRILARRMSERVTTTRTLLTLVAEVAGREHSDWFASELGK